MLFEVREAMRYVKNSANFSVQSYCGANSRVYDGSEIDKNKSHDQCSCNRLPLSTAPFLQIVHDYRYQRDTFQKHTLISGLDQEVTGTLAAC